MALTTTRAGRAGRWRTLSAFAAVTIAFSAFQTLSSTESLAQAKAPSKKQLGQTTKKAPSAQPGDNDAARLNEKWLAEHNEREAAAQANSEANSPAAAADPKAEPDDERVSSVPSMAAPVGARARAVVASSVTLVKAGSATAAFNAMPGGLPIYKDLARAFSGFSASGAPIEMVQGQTADGFSRVLYASIGDGKARQSFWWFAPPDQPEGWFDEQGRRLGGAAFAEPRPGARISSPFGVRRYYGRRTGGGFHNGIDFEGKTGEPIHAVADGVINHQGWYFNYGRTVKISHADNFETLYAHMSRFADGLGPGSHVRRGDVIGYVGSTGRSTGPHLHFSAIVNGQFVNPAPYISADGGGQLGAATMVSFRQWQQDLHAAVEARKKADSRRRYDNLQGGDDWSRNPFQANNRL